jgi:hypothetical protein
MFVRLVLASAQVPQRPISEPSAIELVETYELSGDRLQLLIIQTPKVTVDDAEDGDRRREAVLREVMCRVTLAQPLQCSDPGGLLFDWAVRARA